MTIKRITNTNLESNRVILRPSVEYTMSGSDLTGSIPLINNPTSRIKVVYPTAGSDLGIDDKIANITSLCQNGSDATNKLLDYLEGLQTAPTPSKNNKNFEIKIENIPGIQYNSNNSTLSQSGSLSTIVNSLIERETEVNPNMAFGFTNYNSLGFVSGGNETQNQCLLYEASNGSSSNLYSFGVSFFIKPPKITTDTFDAATIFHIDNIITVSLISGSQLDKNGNVNNFNIVTQFSSSNESSPRSFSYNGSMFDSDILFTSGDEIKKDTWHHVFIPVYKESPRSNFIQKIYIDGNEITGSTTSCSRDYLRRFSANSEGFNNSEITIGNKIGISGNPYSDFFSQSARNSEKFSLSKTVTPSNSFESPFSGEIHEILFVRSPNWNLPINKILSRKNETQKLSVIDSDYNIDFYLPVLFAPVTQQYLKTNLMKFDNGGITQPIETLYSPHENFILSNDLRFPDINITSFLAAYSQNTTGGINMEYPRCIGMSSVIDIASEDGYRADFQNTHEIACEVKPIFTRNNLVRSCDNLNFSHNYTNYKSIRENTIYSGVITANSNKNHFLSSSLGNEDLSHVLMKNYLDQSFTIRYRQGSIYDLSTMLGSNYNRLSDENIFFDNNFTTQRNSPLVPSLYFETGYIHSNLVTLIDIPQMFYSKRIYPGTFEMTDHDISGSNGMLTYKIKDNGLGQLYRDDSLYSDPRNKCGLIFYDLGIVLLTHPSLCLVGKNHYTIKFKGEKDLNVLSVNSHVGKFEFNESTNISYNKIVKNESDSDENEIIMITGIEYLDENLNVVMKSNLSQPVSKREFDEILFRSRIDF